MNEHNKVRFRMKIDDQCPDEMWSFCIGLSHFVGETYLYINFFRWSVSIGFLYDC